MNFNPFFRKKIFFIVFLVIILIYPNKKTEAFWVFIDPANLSQNTISAIAQPVTSFGTQPIIATGQVVQVGKDNFLDGIAYVLAKNILKGMTAETVNWINNGFKGNPAFITNPERFFINQGDLLMENVVGKQLIGLCRPFELQVRIALIKTYLQGPRPPVCTFEKIKKNYENIGENAMDNWDDWFEITQNDENNPYGAFYQSKDFIYTQITSNQKNNEKKQGWGKGFMSFERCKKDGMHSGWRTITEANPNAVDQKPAETGAQGSPYDDNGNFIGANTAATTSITAYDIYDPSEEYCPEDQKEIVTPGSIIEGQLGKVLGSSISQLEIADEINEIASALMNQMFRRAIGGAVSGLRGLSQKKPDERKSLLSEILSKDEDSLGTREDARNLERIDNSIPAGVDEFIKPVTNADGTVTTDVTDIRNVRPGNYISRTQIDEMVDEEVANTQQKYNLGVATDPSGNGQKVVCNPDGTLSDGSGTPCTP